MSNPKEVVNKVRCTWCGKEYHIHADGTCWDTWCEHDTIVEYHGEPVCKSCIKHVAAEELKYAMEKHL